VSSTSFINVTALAPASFSVSQLPSQLSAGTPQGATVSALDVFGNLATGYAGTVHFSSSDARAGLPADFTFTPLDRGSFAFIVVLKSVGTQSLTVADTTNPAFTSTQSGIAVTPGAASVWVFSGVPVAATAGTAQSFTLTAFDAFGNLATNYVGRVHSSSLDSQASLPADYTFTAADAGSHTFSVILKTAGAESINVMDTVNTLFTGSQSITVAPAAAAILTIAGFPATTAGVAQTFTVTARDNFGNLATGYAGTVTFSSSDPLAVLPAIYTFTAGDAGVHTLTAVLEKAGTQSISVKDTSTPTLSGTETGIAVTAAAVNHFAISAPANVSQGVGFSITVSAVDAFGNVVTGYRGKVHFSTTATNAGLSSDFTFSNNDNGVHIFSVTLNTLGFQTVTVTDTTIGSITGSVIVDVLPQNGGGGGGGGGGAA
jgi:hypothetical protein